MPNVRGTGCLQRLVGTGPGLFDAGEQCVATSTACHERAQGHDAGCTIWTVRDEKTIILERFEYYPLKIVSTTRRSDETWSTWRADRMRSAVAQRSSAPPASVATLAEFSHRTGARGESARGGR